MTPRARFGLTALLLVHGVIAADVAGAVKSGAFLYSTPQTGVYSIPVADMAPQGTNAHTAKYSRSSIYFRADVALDDADCFLAGVHLPQGAKLLRVVATFESGVYADPFFRLSRIEFATGYAYSLAFFNPQVDNNSERHSRTALVPASAPRVDNAKYAYDFEFCMGYDDLFYGARIYYQYSNAGD